MSKSGISAIMVPLDGSEAAVRAVTVAARMAVFRGARLHLVGVFRPSTTVIDGVIAPAGTDDFFRDDLRSHLESVAHDVSVFHRLRPDPVLLEGSESVAEQLAAYARLHRIDLVVMRTHGRGGLGRLVLGSVADALINDADVPCLILRDRHAGGIMRESTMPGVFRRILVPLDGSIESRSGIDQAIALATPGITEIRPVLVIPPRDLPVPGAPESVRSAAKNAALDEYLASLTASIEDRGVAAHAVTMVHRSPAEGLLHCIEAQRIDLVSIASHHRSAAGRLLLGSVIDRLVTATDVPLLAHREPTHGVRETFGKEAVGAGV